MAGKCQGDVCCLTGSWAKQKDNLQLKNQDFPPEMDEKETLVRCEIKSLLELLEIL